MECKKAERLLLRSLDGKLEAAEEQVLEAHLKDCPLCQKRQEEYRMIFGLLRPARPVEPRPFFRERVLARLEERERIAPVLFGLKWAHRAVAFSLAASLLFGLGILLFRPQEPQELSSVETLLLRGENPLGEAANILSQSRPEDRNMMLIFASVGETDALRR
jgi:hypothetical protein